MNFKLIFEVVLRNGAFKVNSTDQILAATNISVGALLTQTEDKFNGKLPLFLLSSETRISKSSYKQMSQMVKVPLNQILAQLHFSINISHQSNLLQNPIIKPSQSVPILVKINEIRGYSLNCDFLAIEINGFENESCSKVLEIREINGQTITIDFERQFYINPTIFLASERKIAVIKLVEKFLDRKEQKLVGYSKVSLSNLNNILSQTNSINDNNFVVETGIFELLSPSSTPKGFLSLQIILGKTETQRNPVVDHRQEITQQSGKITHQNNNIQKYPIDQPLNPFIKLEVNQPNLPINLVPTENNQMDFNKHANIFPPTPNVKFELNNSKKTVSVPENSQIKNMEFLNIKHANFPSIKNSSEVFSREAFMGSSQQQNGMEEDMDNKLTVQSEKKSVDLNFHIEKYKQSQFGSYISKTNKDKNRICSAGYFSTFNPNQNENGLDFLINKQQLMYFEVENEIIDN